jgi:hypothetical protein
MNKRIFLFLLCIFFGEEVLTAQTIGFYAIDEISKNNVSFDSIAITRVRDKVRLVTKGYSVNFSSVGVPPTSVETPTVGVIGNTLQIFGFSPSTRCFMMDITGSTIELPVVAQGPTSYATLPEVSIGWHGIVVTDGTHTVQQTMTSAVQEHQRQSATKEFEETEATDDYYAVVYSGSFVSSKYFFSYDPVKSSVVHILVNRPRWMANVIAVDIYESRYPKDPTYHQDLFPNSLRSGQTYIWSFEKDTASYWLSSVDKSPCCQVCYVTGNEDGSARIIFYTMRQGYDVYDVTLKERPVIKGKTVTICGTASTPVIHAWQELNYSTNQLEPRSNSGGTDRCMVFTLK